MKILIYGNKKDSNDLIVLMKTCNPLAFRRTEYSFHENYDAYIGELAQQAADAVFVVTDGADGMEGVIAARDLQRATPVVWFSDDKAFVFQAYRLGTAYFAEKPVCAEKVTMALEKCQVL